MIDEYQIIKDLDFERLAGTKGEEKAREVIKLYLEGTNVDCKVEQFEVVAFDTGNAVLECADAKFEAIPYGLNENTNLEGELVFLENPEIMKYAKGKFEDKIVLSFGYTRGLHELLKENEIKAFIKIGAPFREAPSLSHRQKVYKDGYIPSVTIGYDEAMKLSEYDGQTCHITIKQAVSAREAHNIIVDIPGSDNDNNLIYAVGHYDSVARSHGACDNAGGTATLIKIIEYFSQNQPKRDLRVIFFSGEELGLLGSLDYVTKHEEEVKEKGQLVVNIDVAGDDIGLDVCNVIGTDRLVGYVEGLARESGVYLKTKKAIYSSDCMPFTVHEVPSVNIARAGGKATFHAHTPNDKASFTSRRGLKNPIKAAVNFLDRVLNSEIFPVDREIDESLKEKIERYLWTLTQEEPELQWKPKYKRDEK